MAFGTACHRLRKKVLFSLIQKLKEDICFRCGNKIENEKELSIEHKEDWQNSEYPIELFFDINNITFSHLHCNCKYRKPYTPKPLTHPSNYAYKKGCRCFDCMRLHRDGARIYRSKVKKRKLEKSEMLTNTTVGVF